MTESASPSVTPSRKETAAFLEYWKAQVCERGALLRRQEVDAASLRRILPNVWIYQRLADGDYLCRLAGEEIHRRWGRPVARRRLSEFASGQELSVIRARFDLVTARSLLAFGATRARPDWVAERLYGPVLDDDGEPRVILGCSSPIPWQALQEPGGSLLIERMAFFDPISLAFVQSGPPSG